MLQQILDDPDLITPDQRKTYRDDFRKRSSAIFDENLKLRLNIAKLFNLSKDTGAIDGGAPGLDGRITEADLITALRLIIEREKSKLPVGHNGLGYNNLLYMSLVLASLNYDSDPKKRGQNTVLFPMLVIEEPEAHLHPALQYKLLKHIKKQQREKHTGSRQVFITTHSTHITSASTLDDIICMTTEETGRVRPAYPGKVFSDTPEGVKSKKFVERYLDATKSTMLFSKGILFVEGIAEQLLVPCLANYVDKSLEDYHIALIPVGGLNFKHFLPIFGAGTEPHRMQYALERKVACLVDADPSRKDKSASKYTSCWPYQLDLDHTTYDYKPISGALSNLNDQCTGSTHVCIFNGVKTFEYDFAFINPFCSHLISESATHLSHVSAYANDPANLPSVLNDILAREGLLVPISGILLEKDRQAATFATIYLLTIGDSKGENAFDVEYRLRTLLESDSTSAKSSIFVPEYISNAIRWVCGA